MQRNSWPCIRFNHEWFYLLTIIILFRFSRHSQPKRCHQTVSRRCPRDRCRSIWCDLRQCASEGRVECPHRRLEVSYHGQIPFTLHCIDSCLLRRLTQLTAGYADGLQHRSQEIVEVSWGHPDLVPSSLDLLTGIDRAMVSGTSGECVMRWRHQCVGPGSL